MAGSEVTFGHPEGVNVGDTFDNYKQLNAEGVHRSNQGGISGTEHDGADSIVISHGYPDDVDLGDEIIYTGHGGQNKSGKQIKDQEMTRGNLALVRNQLEGIPVRVIRGPARNNPSAPISGYRYDGLYLVESHWHEIGSAGFRIWRYRLVRSEVGRENPPPAAIEPIGLNGGNESPRRATILVQRIVRDTKQAKEIKRKYRHRCQVCGTFIETEAGRYAEAAHIRPLGKPHNGPDKPQNILCLCPNHHVMFDLGVFSINDDFSLVGIPGRLTRGKWHDISVEHLRYHRKHFSADKRALTLGEE
ncbi:YDG/SRA domain-containing protein [Ensifer adhaerens]|uniref:YDG/SRA domain-containing protein n=1 Tax=Ensifer adhaerens TaxID=106592 RepID=UPI000AFD5779|nr:YDG/SRA domain-containing protein [Ensifer adhaerens]